MREIGIAVDSKGFYCYELNPPKGKKCSVCDGTGLDKDQDPNLLRATTFVENGKCYSLKDYYIYERGNFPCYPCRGTGVEP